MAAIFDFVLLVPILREVHLVLHTSSWATGSFPLHPNRNCSCLFRCLMHHTSVQNHVSPSSSGIKANPRVPNSRAPTPPSIRCVLAFLLASSVRRCILRFICGHDVQVSTEHRVPGVSYAIHPHHPSLFSISRPDKPKQRLLNSRQMATHTPTIPKRRVTLFSIITNNVTTKLNSTRQPPFSNTTPQSFIAANWLQAQPKHSSFATLSFHHTIDLNNMGGWGGWPRTESEEKGSILHL